MLGGALMGVAGAFLSMAQFNAFTFGVVSGRGWVAIALVVFGRWDPWRCAGAALLFAAIDALQLRLQASGLGHIPYEVFLMLPFLLTIVAMALVSRNAVAPAAPAEAVPQGRALKAGPVGPLPRRNAAGTVDAAVQKAQLSLLKACGRKRSGLCPFP